MTTTIHAALVKVQAELPSVKAAEKAKVPTKSGGTFEYSYASLEDINRAMLPLLAKHGLTWTCSPRHSVDAGWVLEGRLATEAGHDLVGQWPLPSTDDPQRLGSAVTYGRRYLLCAMVGLVPADDDDGQVAKASREQHEAAVDRAALKRRITAAAKGNRLTNAVVEWLAEREATKMDELDDDTLLELANTVGNARGRGKLVAKWGTDPDKDDE